MEEQVFHLETQRRTIVRYPVLSVRRRIDSVTLCVVEPLVTLDNLPHIGTLRQPVHRQRTCPFAPVNRAVEGRVDAILSV